MPFYQPTKGGVASTGFRAALGSLSETTTQPRGFYAAIHTARNDKPDLESVDGLLKLAREKGLLSQAMDVADEDKLSFLQRLSVGLGALNPAEAIARNYAGAESFLTAYPKTVLQGIASAFTGNDYGESTKRKYFGDLLKDLGVENKILRFGLGLVGDIFLDPSIYFGGSLVRMSMHGVQAGGRVALKGVAKASPEAAKSLLVAGHALKEAGGHLFVFGYGASKATKTGEARSLAEELLEFSGRKTNVSKALAIANAKRYGNDVLTGDQWEEFLGYMFRGKEAEYNFFDTVTDDMVEAFNKKFPNARFPLKPSAAMKAELAKKFGREVSEIEAKREIRKQVINRLESTSTLIPKKILKLQLIRDKLAEPFIEGDLIGLRQTISELRKELAELTPKVVKGVPKKAPFMATTEQIDGALLDALSIAKNQYKKVILDLEARIAGIEAGIIKPAMKEVTKQVGKKVPLTADQIIQKTMRKLDPSLRFKDEIVKLNKQITQLTNDMFLKQQILERALAGKQIAKEKIAKAFKTGDFSILPGDVALALRPVIDDPKVAETLADRLVRNTKLAAAAGIDDPFTMYAPSIAKDVTERQRLLNFFNGTKGVRLGSKDYVKEFRNLLKDDELLKSRDLFLRVEDEVATNQLTQEFLEKVITDYGEPLAKFKSERDAANAGYRLLKDRGIFGKELGYVNEGDWRFLNSHTSNNYKAFDAIAKASGFDAITSLFKRFVTGPFAAFHVRNFYSGEVQNFELIGAVAQMPKVQAAGMRLATKISRGAFSDAIDPFSEGLLTVGRTVVGFGDETIELGGKIWKLDDIGRAIERRFGGSSYYNTEFNSLTRDADKLLDAGLFAKEANKEWLKSFVSAKLKKNPIEALVGENNPVFRGARVIGAWTEMQQKSKLVVGALQKGLSMGEALRIAAKGGFDYRALTMFESKIMRRIIPFYSFNRKNLELQLKVLGENPQRINQIIRGIEESQHVWETNLTPEEKENLPAYLKEYLSAPVGRSKTGVPQFVRTFGTPIEAFTELFKFSAEGKSTIERTFLGTLSKVNPYIKVPIEIGIQKESFRQRDLKEVYTAPEYEKAPQFLRDYLQLKAVIKKDFVTGQPRTTYVADPVRLLVVRSLFTSRGFTYFNNVFNGNTTGFFKIMDLLSGIRVAEVDVERQAGFTDRRKREELGDLLRRYGIISEFNKLFIPKEK